MIIIFLIYYSRDSDDVMKVWYHPKCMFETLQRARATTKKIETPDDLEDFSNLNDPEKDEIKQLMKGFILLLNLYAIKITELFHFCLLHFGLLTVVE